MRASALPAGAIVLALTLAGPAAARKHAPDPPDWRTSITERDRTRLRDWRAAWLAALAQARGGGAGRRIDAEGVLLQPDAALGPPDPPDGAYRCRVVKLGARDPGGVPFSTERGACRIAGGAFVRLDGAQRPAGRLWPFDGQRELFLGAVAVGDERAALDYGRDPDRDMVGVLERIGPQRWRLVLPRPRWESLLDVIELLPAE